MLGSLIKLATHLDNNGYHKEADYLDAVLKKHAGELAEKAEPVNFCDLPTGPWAIDVTDGVSHLGFLSPGQKRKLKECSDVHGSLLRAKNIKIGLYNVPEGDETGESWCSGHQSQVHCAPKEI